MDDGRGGKRKGKEMGVRKRAGQREANQGTGGVNREKGRGGAR